MIKSRNLNLLIAFVLIGSLFVFTIVAQAGIGNGGEFLGNVIRQ